MKTHGWGIPCEAFHHTDHALYIRTASSSLTHTHTMRCVRDEEQTWKMEKPEDRCDKHSSEKLSTFKKVGGLLWKAFLWKADQRFCSTLSCLPSSLLQVVFCVLCAALEIIKQREIWPLKTTRNKDNHAVIIMRSWAFTWCMKETTSSVLFPWLVLPWVPAPYPGRWHAGGRTRLARGCMTWGGGGGGWASPTGGDTHLVRGSR